MVEQIFIQLALILLTAFVVSYIIRAFNQPIIIGYIIAGILIGPFILLGASTELIDVFSKFGIAFLLFVVGLHLNPKIVKEVGLPSLVIGLVQIILTFALGFVVALEIFKLNLITSAYIGIALAFSSTIITMKLLSDKHQIDSLHSKIAIGILIIQDLVAVVVLMFISSMSGGGSLGGFALRGFLGGGALLVVLFLVGYLILPRITRSVASSQELLFLFSICWCFVIAALFIYLRFSLEMGALVAGIVLSISPYSMEISAKVRPLRDFFLILFFIILGLNLPIHNISSILVNALILSAIVLVFKPLILMTMMALFNYTKRTNFLVGTTLAQISEFSLIILTLGVASGHISGEILSTMILAGVITITLSTYMIIYSNEFYNKMKQVVRIFEGKHAKRDRSKKQKYKVILFGYNRIGFTILKSFNKLRKKYIVVDFNPDTIVGLGKMDIPCLYGDAYDQDLLDNLSLEDAELIVSTIPDYETSFLLLENIRLVNKDAIVIVRAHKIDEALELYKKGASYVLTPHFLGGQYIKDMIDEMKTNPKKYEEEKNQHVKMLEERKKIGHDHPEVERG